MGKQSDRTCAEKKGGLTMNRNETIILVGVLCTSAAIWLMSDLAGALLFLGISLMIVGIGKAAHDEWMNS